VLTGLWLHSWHFPSPTYQTLTPQNFRMWKQTDESRLFGYPTVCQDHQRWTSWWRKKWRTRRAPLWPGASFSQDRGCRCNTGKFPKEKIPGLVANSSSRPILLVYSDGRVKSSSLAWPIYLIPSQGILAKMLGHVCYHF